MGVTTPSRGGSFLADLPGLMHWRKRGYLDHAPQGVKESVLLAHGVPGAPWIETGTFRGTTTTFLLRHFGKVYSIEPEPKLFAKAAKRFAGKDVELFNDVSETVLPDLLPRISGDCNFWLDGHYSAGVTFQGSQDCPVEDELAAIAGHLDRLGRVSILIDDVRCFLPSNTDYPDYPTLDRLVDWTRAHGLEWRIEHDIFIAKTVD